jgi:ribosomal protein L7/L12
MGFDEKMALSANVVAALTAGGKIEAIKLLREENGAGLKEAKDIIDAYLASRPDLSAAMNAEQQARQRGFLRVLVCIGLFAAAAFLLLRH